MKEYLTESGAQSWEEGITDEINTVMMSKILRDAAPCPWCGKTDLRFYQTNKGLVYGDMLKSVYAECGYCGSRGPSETIPYITEAEICVKLSIRRWNDRLAVNCVKKHRDDFSSCSEAAKKTNRKELTAAK